MFHPAVVMCHDSQRDLLMNFVPFGRLLLPVLACTMLAACTPTPSAALDPELAKMVMPDPGPPTGRPLGAVIMQFTSPVADKSAAQAMLAQLNRRIQREDPALHLNLLGPVSGGNWRVAMQAATSDLSAERALALVRAQPEVRAVEPDRLLQPATGDTKMPVRK
jgi:outer membrane biogenesis lipoprotein LolB